MMTNLPVSVIWLITLMYFGCGQTLDNADIEGSFNQSGNGGRASNISTVIPKDDADHDGSRPPATEGEGIGGEAERREVKNATSNFGNSRTVFDKGRGKRRPVTYRTPHPSNASEAPVMSPERRNSYLSIAERRKYYNKTHDPVRKQVSSDAELENQETTNKIVLSAMTETLQSNEISVSRKPAVKESTRTLTDSQKALGGFQNNEKQKKMQSTRQSVIQSQFQFGQKLNLRKPVTRVQEQPDRPARNKEKTINEFSVEDSTVKPSGTQSTQLLKVKESVWATTPALGSDDEGNEFFLTYDNETNAYRPPEHVTENKTRDQTNAFSNSNNTFFGDNRVPESGGQAKVPAYQAIKLKPLPLNYEKSRGATNEEEGTHLATNIQSVYGQEILRLNATRKTVKVPLKILESYNKTLRDNAMKHSEGTTPPLMNNSAPPDSATDISLNGPTTEILPSNRNLSFVPSLARNNKVPNPGPSSAKAVIQPSRTLADNRSNHGETGRDTSTTNPVPSVKVIPKQLFNRSKVYFLGKTRENSSFEESKVFDISMTKANPAISRNPTAPTPSFIDSSGTIQEYPLTIELNENNKRVLSEMFQTSTPTKVNKVDGLAGSDTDRAENNVSDATEESSVRTTTEATSDIQQKVTMDEYQKEDRKAMGSRYNTKFYISPNVSKIHQKVIKVVDIEEEEEGNGVALLARPIGVAAYVLAAFGVVPLLLALIFITRLVIQRRQRRYECESDSKSDLSSNECQLRQTKKGQSELKKSPSNVTTTTLVTNSRLPRIHHWESVDKQGNRNWEFPRSKLKLKTILGQGNFGQVWKAEAEDMAGLDGKTQLVAIKTVKEGATEKENMEFIKELEIMQQIGSHPNIVTLLGCCTDQEPHYLIMEYVKYGKLLTYLREHRVNENYYNFSSNVDALTSKDLTVFSYCIARGMEYLASRGIIHRDLAARNVLVDHNKVCKIADFGMSRSVRNLMDGEVYEERQHKGALPIRWMAPESLVYSVFTFKSDVWSFGIVMWEIVTLGSTPYPNLGAREVMRKVRDGYRLERPSHCNPEFYRLMSHCWSHDPNKRPDFSELRQDLSSLLENPVKDGSYVDFERFAACSGFHISNKSNDVRLLERNEFKTKKLANWDCEDWPEETKKTKARKAKNNGKGTVTLTGQGSFTVNSRILEKEFKMI